MSKTNRLVVSVMLALVIGGSIYYLITAAQKNSYTAEIQGLRNEKDAWFSTNAKSPFVLKNEPFHRIKYYPPNRKYFIKARFIRNTNQDSVTLITNLGETERLLIYGEALFNLDGTDCRLQLFYLPESTDLFLPFMDATSGQTTYGSGRYLEVATPTEDEVILDFNLAYNPYCAYVDGYSCPFPPKANVLPVAIEAGEKTYHE